MANTCPRCQQPFVCRPEAIHDCACAQVSLTDEARTRIRAYTERTLNGYVCLCANCLQELASQPQPFKNNPA